MLKSNNLKNVTCQFVNMLKIRTYTLCILLTQMFDCVLKHTHWDFNIWREEQLIQIHTYFLLVELYQNILLLNTDFIWTAK